MAEQTPKGAQRLDTATELAFDRTRAAYERTMMAWIRTATSLITFGFTIYKFFQIEVPDRGQQNRLIGPRQFAFILVSIGLFSLILAFHHLQILSDRSAGPRTTESPHRSTPVRLHTGEHRSLLTDSGDPRTPPKYPYAWSAVRGQAALTGSAGRRIDLRPRDTCTSRDNFSSISIIHIDTTGARC